MALTKLDKNLNIVSALDNEPNDVGGLTSEDLKAKFDEGSKAIQEYINETLIPETEEAIAAVAGRADEVREELKEDMESLATKQELRGVVLGQIPNGTITEEKLDPDFVNSRYTKEETDELFAEVPAQIADAEKVGDIKVTIRNDLGDKWLPCGGQVFDVGEYPDLPELLPEPNTLTSMAQTNIPANFYGADYANGICVSFGNRANSSGTYRWFGSIDGGTNSFQTISGNASWYHAVQYDKGSDTWVSACYESNTAYSYATKDPVNGTWVSKPISTMSNKYDHFFGHNGLWVAIGSQSSRDSSRNVTSSMWISTTTDPINGEWSAEKKIGDRGSGNHDYASIHYHNGIWVIVTEYEESASAGGGYGVATYTTTDPVNGTWTKREILGGTQSKYVYGLQAHEGTWVMPIYDGYNCYLYTTTDPVNGEWSASPKFTFKAGSATYSNPFFTTRCIRWHLGKWYVLASASTNNGQACFLASTDNNGETWSAIDMGINYGRSLCTDGKILIAQTTNGTSSNSAKYLAYKLPEISVENANTFIKAKM